MNFLADESVDRPIVERLRREGHRVSYVAELGPGMPDDAVLHLANQETALVRFASSGRQLWFWLRPRGSAFGPSGVGFLCLIR